jgi:hypothetical protein
VWRIAWLTSVKKLLKQDAIIIRATIKSPKLSMALEWDRVDFHKEWFRGGDLNGFRDIWALPVSRGGNHHVMS